MDRNDRCAYCGHARDWHRHDDADNTPPTDPACKFRCIGYDCMSSGPPAPCYAECPDYKEPDYKWHLPELFKDGYLPEHDCWKERCLPLRSGTERTQA